MKYTTDLWNSRDNIWCCVSLNIGPNKKSVSNIPSQCLEHYNSAVCIFYALSSSRFVHVTFLSVDNTVRCYNTHRKQQEVMKIAQPEKKDNNHQISNNRHVSEEDRPAMEEGKERDRSYGERICVNGVQEEDEGQVNGVQEEDEGQVNGVQEEDEGQVTNPTEHKHDVTCT